MADTSTSADHILQIYHFLIKLYIKIEVDVCAEQCRTLRWEADNITMTRLDKHYSHRTGSVTEKSGGTGCGERADDDRSDSLREDEADQVS